MIFSRISESAQTALRSGRFRLCSGCSDSRARPDNYSFSGHDAGAGRSEHFERWTMKYAIMCGGDYPEFQEPKQFQTVNGERLIERTVRLLKENGVFNICITSNNPAFDGLGVERIEDPQNDYIHGTDRLWLNAFYPFHEEVCYLYGDVYYTDRAIKTIISCSRSGNILFGSAISMNKAGENWGEPFAYLV